MPDQPQQPLTREELLAIIEQAAREKMTTDVSGLERKSSCPPNLAQRAFTCNIGTDGGKNDPDA